MEIVRHVAAMLAAYLLGAIPVGRIVGKALRGVDVTRVASGRIGATNVLRAAGFGAAALTVLGDALKGALAVVVGRSIGNDALSASLAASSAVIGHIYSVFVGWRGGVGTITNLGATAALSFPLAGVLAVVGALVVGVSRHSSLGSIAIAILLPVALLVWALTSDASLVYVLHGVVSGAVALWALRPNIERLRQGTERKIGEAG